MNVEHRGCQLADDLRGDGSPVLLIQGVGVQGDGWRPQVDALAARHRCLWFDNRGMGRSQPVGAPLSIELMAEDARKLLDVQGWDSAHVVGHSMGGPIALALALSARSRVRSLSLLCTFSRGAVATRPSPAMLWLGLRSRIGTRRQRRHAFLQIVMPAAAIAASDRDALAERLGKLFGHDLALQPPIVMRQLAALRRFDATPRLGSLSGLPTLVVSATHDRIAPPSAGRALAAGIPGARYVEIADAGHGVPIQCADRINALLLEHFAAAE